MRRRELWHLLMPDSVLSTYKYELIHLSQALYSRCCYPYFIGEKKGAREINGRNLTLGCLQAIPRKLISPIFEEGLDLPKATQRGEHLCPRLHTVRFEEES